MTETPIETILEALELRSKFAREDECVSIRINHEEIGELIEHTKGIADLRLRITELEAENARLKAPVSEKDVIEGDDQPRGEKFLGESGGFQEVEQERDRKWYEENDPQSIVDSINAANCCNPRTSYSPRSVQAKGAEHDAG